VALWDLMKRDTHAIPAIDGRRKGVQRVVVIVVVRERDEALVPTAIVPAEAQTGQTAPETLVQDALQFVHHIPLLRVPLLLSHAHEE